ncbi:MAG: hypothetical protein C4K60_13235 [Ideonella sp. MAG2]|nr:MAG: hypothetical protein C4K60_13235 [Ideonella sp. MAG2]
MPLQSVKWVVLSAYWLTSAVMAAPLEPNCQVIDLGDLPEGDHMSQATAINERGHVVGFSSGAESRYEAFWYAQRNMSSISKSAPGGWSVAYAVNRSGQVVGVEDGVYAFRWQGGQKTRLEDLVGGSIFSVAYGLNDAGEAVGVCNDGVGINSACKWPSGSELPVRLDAGIYSSMAKDINNLGDVVGQDRMITPFRDRAVLWPSGGGMVELVAGNSIANAINDEGVVVGNSEFGAFVWRAGQVQFLPSGSQPSHYNDEALAVNRHGVVAGAANWYGNKHAALWVKGSLIRLADYACVQQSGWTLYKATGINDRGDIVGNGLNPAGFTAAFKIIRKTPPSQSE